MYIYSLKLYIYTLYICLFCFIIVWFSLDFGNKSVYSTENVVNEFKTFVSGLVNYASGQ